MNGAGALGRWRTFGRLAVSAGVGLLLFGDLSHIVIRAFRPKVQRKIEVGQADITRGEALYVGRCRADATLFDPSNGAFPPVTLAAVN